jgi:hypothetical protein
MQDEVWIKEKIMGKIEEFRRVLNVFEFSEKEEYYFLTSNPF